MALTPHERDQMLHVLRHTTPRDRILWAEQMRLLMGPEHLRKSREMKWQLNRNDDGSEKRVVPKPANAGDQ